MLQYSHQLHVLVHVHGHGCFVLMRWYLDRSNIECCLVLGWLKASSRWIRRVSEILASGTFDCR